MYSYRVNEIFYSIQGEGEFAGAPAVFVRFSGCNLACPWCDTDHSHGVDMTRDELEDAVKKLLAGHDGAIIVLTGGEPALQLHDDEPLFQGFARFLCIETNGTQPVPGWIDWITVSPKNELSPIVPRPNELKFVFEPEHIPYYLSMQEADCILNIQPLARKDGTSNLREAVDFVLAHPRFKLSVQLHKMIGVR
ncbi:MAG: radical SAM protein [Lentisphaeria bacterium]|nr:radical SAM protein [Lentisphaeria bacterium]